tara:strand:+ start:78 stop:761 length:684 start_codon:yes stop_codon:yes gene_type:complete
MEIYMEEPQINYRYERKFLVPEIYYNEILSSLYNMNYFVKYESRLINNIYFDNYNFSSLTENIEGLSQRKKYRIRWYGETFKNSNKSIEIKIKNEFVNSKKSYTFQNLKLNSLEEIKPFYNNLKKIIFKSDNKNLYNCVDSRVPTLFNKYNRMYFVDHIQKTRVTVDKNLNYFSPITGLKVNEKSIIIEAKYDKESQFINNFKYLSFTRYSKYVKGLLQTSIYRPNY